MRKVVLVLVVAIIVAICAMAVVGCEDQLVTRAPDTTDQVVDVDLSELYYSGKITIYNGEFIHERFVVDYVKGDPTGIDPYHDIFGIYVQVYYGGETTNKAILKDGSIITLDTKYKVLPRDQEFILNGNSQDKQQLTLRPNLEGDTYSLTVYREGQRPIFANKVSDAWTAYDTVYWLVGQTAYKLNWLDPEAQPEVFIEGAYAISHESDEAEGALVPEEMANYTAYGRVDRYSPYGGLN